MVEYKDMLPQFKVEVVEIETGAVVKSLGPFMSRRHAFRVEDGVEINLDLDKYFVRTIEV